jgi:hypothetical protein
VLHADFVQESPVVISCFRFLLFDRIRDRNGIFIAETNKKLVFGPFITL